MVDYVLGKVLQKYKVDKLSQVMFPTVELIAFPNILLVCF